MRLLEKLFGTYSERELKKIYPIADQIEALDEEMKKLTDDQLKGKTIEFRKRLEDGETLDDILVEAFATMREAADRVLGMKHYRVQLIGGIVLHQGRIAEMKTGEGKTLVATLPVYLNGLSGKGVHVVTVNDYLAERDMQWMGKVYTFLGLSIGCILNRMEPHERKIAYGSDVTYGTNNEYGFDYLRDNMAVQREDRVQRGLNFAIVDEVDSILIDEARTPLIISGPGEKSTELYDVADNFVKTLEGRTIDEKEKKDMMFERSYKIEDVDYVIDEKQKAVTLTEKGTEKSEEFFKIENLTDPENMELLHHLNQALKANNTMKKDIDYVIEDGEILIVDEFTGRIMYGRRYSDGLHQAIEAKERLKVMRESKTLATITFQNYFRMYKKLSGMTGTAKTEEEEFRDIYSVDVIEIPTNKPVERTDYHDMVYKNIRGKLNAVVDEIEEKNKNGQPILVGTISIEMSEVLSSLLKKRNIKHEVLNAKQYAREAEIIAQAGRFGAVTIATNMAGRGTDIVLGGNPEYMAKSSIIKRGQYSDDIIAMVDAFNETNDEELIKARADYNKLLKEMKIESDGNTKKVLDAGGLHIIGTERHETRRIDNQLRGRAGRQGDVGSSKFYVSLEDILMRLFGGDKLEGFVERLGFEEDQPLEHNMLSRSIEGAQRKIEGNNYSIRKNVLKYDDVMNKQREIIYAEREKVLDGDDVSADVQTMLNLLIKKAVATYTEEGELPSEWDLGGLEIFLEAIFPIEGKLKLSEIEKETRSELEEKVQEVAEQAYREKEERIGSEVMRQVERALLLRNVDAKWMDHIDAMAQLRQGISLRALGQEDPTRAYQREGFEMFEEMIDSIQEDTVRQILGITENTGEGIEVQAVEMNPTPVDGEDAEAPVQEPTTVNKIRRNDPCPCGSGEKYKKCCGK